MYINLVFVIYLHFVGYFVQYYFSLTLFSVSFSWQRARVHASGLQYLRSQSSGIAVLGINECWHWQRCPIPCRENGTWKSASISFCSISLACSFSNFGLRWFWLSL